MSKLMIGPIHMVTRLHIQVINISLATFRDPSRQDGSVSPTGKKRWIPPRPIKLALRPEAPALLFQKDSGRLHALKPPEFSPGIFSELWCNFGCKRLWLWDRPSGISDWSLLDRRIRLVYGVMGIKYGVPLTTYPVCWRITSYLSIVHGYIILGCFLLCKTKPDTYLVFFLYGVPLLCPCILCPVHFSRGKPTMS